MIDLKDRLRAIREAKFGPRGKSKMAEIIQISDSVWGRYEAGISVPGSDVLTKVLHKIPEINPTWLMTGEGKSGLEEPDEKPVQPTPATPPVATPAEAHFDVIRVIEPGFREVGREEIEGDPTGKYVPLIDRLAAGAGLSPDRADSFSPGDSDTLIAYEKAPAKAFALRVTGDSMEPKFLSGDVVIVDPDRQARENDVACVLYKDEGGTRIARFKRWRREGGRIILESLNARHPPDAVPASRFLAAYDILDHLHRIVERRRW